MNKYFDLHFHPIAKNHLRKYGKEDSGARDIAALTGTIEMSKGFMDFTDEVVLRMLESQSCVDHLKKGNVALGVAVISALEFGVASSKSFFSDLMKTGFAKPLDQEYFEEVREGKVSYLKLFLKEVEQYIKLKNEGSLNFLEREKPKKLTGKSPNLVLGIEGGHNLSTKKIGNALEYDEFKEFNVNNLFDIKTTPSAKPQDVLKWLVDGLQLVGIDVLYLTLTHLTHVPEQHLATHAFGTKMLKHPSLYPFGSGISELGKKVIDKAYELKAPNKHQKSGLIIDIKHMSLKSRQDLYDHRKPKEGRATIYEDIPLIASHVGVTGYSTNDWKDNLVGDQCFNHVDQGIKTIKINTKPKVAGYWGTDNRIEFTFNSNTINLMDEDIIEIVKSKGLIGVGLDVRLLGSDSNTADHDDTYEFLSTAEFVAHFPYTGLKSLEFTNADEIKLEEKWLKPTRKVTHPLSLCFNIVHILAVIKLKTRLENEEDFKNYVCIGSDFDGFIEPLKVCGSSEQMKELEANLLKWMPVAAKRYQDENGGTDDLFEFTKKKQELEKVVEAILFTNGKRFLEKRGFLKEVTTDIEASFLNE